MYTRFMDQQQNVDTYIGNFPRGVQERLQEVRQVIRQVIPDATERISYGIPTYSINNHNIIHFGGYPRHISIYPGAQALEYFAKKLTGYKTSKGTLQFPLDAPLPLELIREITTYSVSANQPAT